MASEDRHLGTRVWGSGHLGPVRWGFRVTGLRSQDLSLAVIHSHLPIPAGRNPGGHWLHTFLDSCEGDVFTRR